MLGRIVRHFRRGSVTPPSAHEQRVNEEDPSAEQAHQWFEGQQYQAAQGAFDRLFLRHGRPSYLVNRGLSELMLGQPELARQSFLHALALSPQLPHALAGLGDVCAREGDHRAAIGHFDAALAVDGGLVAVRNNRAESHFALGNLRAAWADAESRYQLPNAGQFYPHGLALERWSGESDARVLVHWEQGFGDILQHLRFLPLLAERCRSLVFECPPPLFRLAQRMKGGQTCLMARNVPPATLAFDRRLPLLSLAYALNLDPADLPACPYLFAGTTPTPWQMAVEPLRQQGPVVGLVWQASAFDARRNIPFEAIALMLRQAWPWRWVCVQHGVSASESGLLSQWGCAVPSMHFEDFDASASALSSLDALLTVDTSMAHLAGGLGVPTALALNEPAAVRWMLDRTDTPWYGRMHLVRKRAAMDWSDLLADACHALDRMLGQATPSEVRGLPR